MAGRVPAATVSKKTKIIIYIDADATPFFERLCRA
jgi:hypothetical protein